MEHSGVALVDPYKIFEKIGLSTGMRVADLGCGRTGHFVFPAARVINDNGVVYAIDILKEVLENIKSRSRTEGYDNVQIIWSNIEVVGKTPVPPQSLDACFFINVMFQIKEKLAALQEATRLLKTGGKIVVVDWQKKVGTLGPNAEAMVDHVKLVSLGESCGLQLAEDFLAGDYHFCLIFNKL